ncbi:MAG TPA: hypothetical protein PKY10_02470 [Lentisphaeria bacterium]|nr:hypothetical protein [Lentisphaeria bacterium]
MRIKSFLIIMGVLLSRASFAAAPEPVSLTDFSKEAGAWQSRVWKDDGTPQTTPLTTLPAEGDAAAALALPVAFPARLEVVAPLEGNPAWLTADSLEWRFRLPDDLPPTTMITIFAKDNDHLWRQIRRRMPPIRDGVATVIAPLRGRSAVLAWECHGHNRPWNSLTAANLLEFGCILELDTGETTPYAATIRLESIRLLPSAAAAPTTQVSDFSYQPRRPLVGERIEFTLRPAAWPAAPFDSSRTKLLATITTPASQTETVRGFYFEDFLYNPEEWDKTRCLIPDGEPCFKVRYCPRQEGEHIARFHMEIDGQAYEIPETRFVARTGPENFRGFVYRDPKHDQFFAYDDGMPFWGLGINVRSPFDNRYRSVVPYSTWEDQGLAVYDRLFRKYRDCGINVVEVWMCSWWLALEWINDAPGFHGVGHYNQYRAWMLDHILRLAEANGIYLILVINNHGKFGMTYDTEWDRNPYNKANGGFLEKCEDYFTNERAREATRKLLDYIVARWTASPNLLSWKLFTEVDLTGPSLEFYHDPSVAAWHRDMGAYLKTIDLYKHPVNTHWMLSYQRINDAIATLPELDFISTDAYYSLGSGTASLVKMLRDGAAFAKARQKPMAITEFGGSSYADNMGNLLKQIPIGMWTGFFNEAGIIPMYWWFALVEEKNLYHHYVTLNRFGGAEDRRGMAATAFTIPDTALEANLLCRPDRILGWIFDRDFYFTDLENNSAAPRNNVRLVTPAPQPGNYDIEFWDLQTGAVIETKPCQVPADSPDLAIDLPPFQRDIAFKIISRPME